MFGDKWDAPETPVLRFLGGGDGVAGRILLTHSIFGPSAASSFEGNKMW